MLILTRAIAALLVSVAVALAPQAPLARANPQLLDQRGHAFTLASLRGMPLVVTFVSAHCTDACPLVDAEFALAARRFAALHVPVRLLTVTLDPQRDTPATMRALAHRFGADPRTWLVAGGRVSNVRAVMAQFGVVAQRGRDGYADVHSTFVYLLDRDGRWRKTMLASTDLGDQIVSEVQRDWNVLEQ